MSALAMGGLAVYVILLLLMLAYGANSFLLVALHARHRRNAPSAAALPDDLPCVTVQLPVYNEENVVARLIEAAGALDWPRDRLEIQVLDDSTDGTSEIAAAHVALLKERGIDAHHIRRADRRGFKAGALALGMSESRGEFLAIFDADFVPPRGFLRQAIGRFQDARVAAVQGRWTHLNRGYSSLTSAQALAIDGHFGVEQAARYWQGWLLNFNGTGGVWRRAAIEAAGGWSSDTLTEDLDLSYRAQLAGWQIVYDPDLECPSELPTQLAAFKLQQRRWATGSMQTARKLLPSIWRAPIALAAKLQATLHLTHYAVHPLIALTALLSVPCVLLPGVATSPHNLWALLLPFALAMSGPTLLYLYAERVLGEKVHRPARDLATLTLVGIGIAVSNGRAVLAGLRGRRDQSGRTFERTPKLGFVGSNRDSPSRAYRVPSDGLVPFEVALAIYCLAAGMALVWTGVYVIAPFMLLDAAGLAWVAARGVSEARAEAQA